MNTKDIFNEILKKSEKSQVEIAELIGTNKQEISAIKSGRRGISLKRLHKIADILGFKILICTEKK